MAVEAKQRAVISTRTASYIVLALAIAVSGYLSWLKIGSYEAVCIEGSVFDCGTVLSSVYSEVAGIPIAWLGLVTNLIVVALLALENRVGFLREYGAILIFGVVLFATLFSIYLIYVQAALIRAYCPWCLAHEALIFILFGFSTYRLWKWFNSTDDTEETEMQPELQA